MISLPSGHAANGVPTGIQIVGRSYSDADVFRAAMAFEMAQGGWYRDNANPEEKTPDAMRKTAMMLLNHAVPRHFPEA